MQGAELICSKDPEIQAHTQLNNSGFQLVTALCLAQINEVKKLSRLKKLYQDRDLKAKFLNKKKKKKLNAYTVLFQSMGSIAF